ncbi:hypothetical protein HDV01_003641 [Terramyces sp. JEL0728]|nr:hypothetical protein HDV01_003641 [Terramyces sp. JEL0728]
MSSVFTCLSCQVAFETAQLQRDHMRTDWHRYNLKRKVVELPPVSFEAFSQKVTSQQQQQELDKQEFSAYCEPCKKEYSSENQYKSHCLSKKHLEKAKNYVPKEKTVKENVAEKTNWKQKLGEAQTEQEINDILDEKIKNSTRLEETDCLFCTHKSGTFEESMDHMANKHSFFIPDIEHLVDLKGLVQYLADKISIANVCIYCNGKGRALHALDAVRDHMVSKGHCKIPYEDGDEDDVAEYYDFEKDDEWEDEGGEDGEVEDDDWSTMDRTATITADDTEMILPSGVRIGNRQFRKYWKQNIKPVAIVPGSIRDPEMISRLSNNYKTLGFSTPAQFSQALVVQQRRLELKQKHKSTKMIMQKQQLFESRVGQKANKLQHHYREQNPF